MFLQRQQRWAEKYADQYIVMRKVNMSRIVKGEVSICNRALKTIVIFIAVYVNTQVVTHRLVHNFTQVKSEAHTHVAPL